MTPHFDPGGMMNWQFERFPGVAALEHCCLPTLNTQIYLIFRDVVSPFCPELLLPATSYGCALSGCVTALQTYQEGASSKEYPP